MGKWEEVRLRDISHRITKGTTPTTVGGVFCDYGINFIKSESITNSKYLDKSKYSYIDEKTNILLSRSILNKNDILFSIAGMFLGKIGIVRDSDLPANTNQAVAIIRIDEKKADINYLYYYMSQSSFTKYVNTSTAQSAQPNINLTQVGKLKLFLPALPTQTRIADILSTYDDLIENNNRRIELLEKAAQELYKEWFVRFRFPNHENTKFVNGLPEGWEVKKLSKLINVKYGKDHKSLCDGSIPVYGSGGIMRFCNKAIYKKESVLIPRKGTLNNITYINEPFWVVDTMFFTEIIHPNVAKYIYYVLSKIDMNAFNSGAALPSMTTDILNHMKIIVPRNDLLEKFDLLTEPFYMQVKKLKVQNQNLKKQRDLLLPRLMSGRLEV